jgi:hypothetical protein
MAVATLTLGWLADVGKLAGACREDSAGLLAQPAIISAARLAGISNNSEQILIVKCMI